MIYNNFWLKKGIILLCLYKVIFIIIFRLNSFLEFEEEGW